MSTVKNVTLAPLDAGDGRLVGPGRTVENVDLEAPPVAMQLRAGAFIEIPAEAEPTARERVAHVAAADLPGLDRIEAAERDRDDGPRKTVLDAIAARRTHLNDQETES